MEGKETYSIEVRVRDENGNILRSPDNNIKQPRLQFEFVVTDVDQLKWKMINVARVLRAWLPEGYDIDVEASVHNSISNTYMCMYSFYESENRFVKH